MEEDLEGDINEEAEGYSHKYKKLFYRDGKMHMPAWERLGRMVAAGLTDEQVCAVYDIDETTFYKWCKEHEEFKAAIDKNKKRFDDETIVAALYQRAKGFKGKETKAFVIGGKIQTTEVTKHYPPETSAISMWLYNRQPEQWRAISHIDYNNKAPVPPENYDISKLTDEEAEYFEWLLLKMLRE